VFLRRCGKRGAFAKIPSTRVFGSMERPLYGDSSIARRLSSRFHGAVRPHHAVPGSASSHLHTRRKTRARGDQGIVFAVTKGAENTAKTSTIRDLRCEARQSFGSSPRPKLALWSAMPQRSQKAGNRRLVAQAVGLRAGGVSSIKLGSRWWQAQVSKDRKASNAFGVQLPPLPRWFPGGIAVQNGDQFDPRIAVGYEEMAEAEGAPAAGKRGCSSSPTAMLDSTQRGCGQDRTRSKASDLGHHDAESIGNTDGRRCSAANYVNPVSTLRDGPIQVIPAGATRHCGLSPEALGLNMTLFDGRRGPAGPAIDIWCRSKKPGDDPNALTHYNQLESATSRAWPSPA